MKNNLADNTADKQRKGRPFEPGQSGNPKGRPKGSKNWNIILEEAINKVQETKDETVLERFVKQAYSKPQIMIALVKKLVADKTHTQIEEVENPELVMAKARGSFKRKLDNIAERLGDIGEDTSKQKSGPVEAGKDDNIKLDDTTPKVRIEKGISEEPDKSGKIIVSKGMGYGKYDEVIIK